MKQPSFTAFSNANSPAEFSPEIAPEIAPEVAPEISVVMPFYNAAATVAATVASVLTGAFPHFELIAIDDGSTDTSLSIVLDLASRDARIKVLSRRNGGVSSARNLGVDTARAPLIAFLDADDLWSRDKLACHAALHRAYPELAASFARIAFVAKDASDLLGAATCSSMTTPSPRMLDLLGENPVCTASNLVVQRVWCQRLGGFDETLSFAEDQEFVAHLAARGGRIKGIDAVLTGYRFSADGLSTDFGKMHSGWRLVVDRHLDTPENAHALEALYCRYLARRVLRSGTAPLRAMTYVIAGLRLDARSFLAERKRGFSTILAALVAPLIPAPLRLRLFA